MLIARNTRTALPFSEKNFSLLQAHLTQVTQQAETLSQALDQANKKIAWFEEQFKLSRDRQFGRSSEKLPSQQILFDAMECDEIKTVEEKETITYTRSKPQKSCGRKLDTSKLPRERVLHDVEEKIS
ncbi:MAG: transposase [Pseudomonadota bacterium]